MKKSILDDKKRGEICGILAMGGSRAVAARYVGCSKSTVYRAAQANPQFARQLRQAEGRAEILQLKYISDAAQCKQYWRAAAWMLERRFPQRYAPRPAESATLEQFEQVVNAFVDLIVAEIADAELRQRILDRLQEVAEQLQPQPPAGRKVR
jgi:hypothetical protein